TCGCHDLSGGHPPNASVVQRHRIQPEHHGRQLLTEQIRTQHARGVVGVLGDVVGGGDHIAQDALQRIAQIDAPGRGCLEQQHHGLLTVPPYPCDIQHVVHPVAGRHQLTTLNDLGGFGHHLQQPCTGRTYPYHRVTETVLDVGAERGIAAIQGAGTYLHLTDVLVDAALRHAHDHRRYRAEEDLVEGIQVMGAALALVILDQAVHPVVGNK